MESEGRCGLVLGEAARAARASAAGHFAEGYTGTGFDEYLTFLNHNVTAAAVTVTCFLDGGAPVVKNIVVGPSNRRTIAVHDAAEGFGQGHEVAVRVATTIPGGVVVERPSYVNYAGSMGGGVTGDDANSTRPDRDPQGPMVAALHGAALTPPPGVVPGPTRARQRRRNPGDPGQEGSCRSGLAGMPATSV
jgi:hypothetical protein